MEYYSMINRIKVSYMYNMDEHRNHHAKQKKSDAKDHILCDSIDMKCPRMERK